MNGRYLQKKVQAWTSAVDPSQGSPIEQVFFNMLNCFECGVLMVKEQIKI